MTEHEDFTVRKLLISAMACSRENSAHYMEMLANSINDVCKLLGTEDRVKWPGKWANVFHFEIGSKDVPPEGPT